MMTDGTRAEMQDEAASASTPEASVGCCRRFFGTFTLLPTIFGLRLGVEWAAALAFHTLLALVPMIIIVFSLLGWIQDYFDLEEGLKQMLLDRGLPEAARQAGDVIGDLVDRVSGSATGLGALGFVFLMVTALGLFGTLEHSCNSLWKLHRASYARRVRSFLIVLVAGPILVGMSLYATIRLRSLAADAQQYEWAGPALRAALFIAPFVITWLVFYCLITFIPNTRVRRTSGLLGAVVAGSLWEMAKKGFNLYVAHSTQIDTLYGPLGILPLFIIWVHVTWIITLLGVQISNIHQHYPKIAAEVKSKRAERRARRERRKARKKELKA